MEIDLIREKLQSKKETFDTYADSTTEGNIRFVMAVRRIIGMYKIINGDHTRLAFAV